MSTSGYIHKTPVVGSEQTVDVDLDKRMTFTPPKTGYRPAGAREHWQWLEALNSADDTNKAEDNVVQTGELYSPL